MQQNNHISSSIGWGDMSERNIKLSDKILRDKNWNKEVSESIMQICKKYSVTFLLKGNKLSHTNSVTHKILILTDHRRINQQIYRFSARQRSIVEKKTAKMPNDGIINKSTSHWNAPKYDGSNGEKQWRKKADLRKLNKITIKECSHFQV